MSNAPAPPDLVAFLADQVSLIRQEGFAFGWTDGGCWMLAEALHGWSEGKLDMKAVWTQIGSFQPGVNHVVVASHHGFFDADGPCDHDALLARMTGDSRHPHWIDDFRFEDAAGSCILHMPKLIEDLQQRLLDAFGPYDPALLWPSAALKPPVSQWTVETLAEATCWSPQRCQGYLDGLRDLANGAAMTPWVGRPHVEEASSDFDLPKGSDRWCLGYMQAVQWAALDYTPGYEGVSPEELRQEAALFDNTEDEGGYVEPEDADWAYVANYPLDKLLAKFGGVEGCKQWFREECQFSMEEGRGGYGYLVVQPIREAAVLVERDGEPFIWDGWHRIAASIVKGETTIKAIVGEPKPEYSFKR
jgi:hypothetical protein